MFDVPQKTSFPGRVRPDDYNQTLCFDFLVKATNCDFPYRVVIGNPTHGRVSPNGVARSTPRSMPRKYTKRQFTESTPRDSLLRRLPSVRRQLSFRVVLPQPKMLPRIPSPATGISWPD